jgi:hypothetical protein
MPRKSIIISHMLIEPFYFGSKSTWTHWTAVRLNYRTEVTAVGVLNFIPTDSNIYILFACQLYAVFGIYVR